MLQRFFYKMGLVGFVVCPLVLIGAWIYYLFFVSALDKNSTQTIAFTVGDSWSSKKIGEELEAQGVLRSWASFYYLYRQMKDEVGGELSIAAGEYELSPAMTPEQVMQKMTSAERVQYTINIAPGATVPEVVSSIAATKLAEEKELQDLLRTPVVLTRAGIPAATPEGYFLEGTYVFVKPITGERIISKIIEQSKAALEQKVENWQARAAKLGFRPYEVLVLASLIEKETSVDSERPKIASALHNRIKLEMPLESKAALAYGLEKPIGALTQDDVSSSTQYNTFGSNKGLPPTPICSPGYESIKAVLYPEVTDYIYWVETPGQTHEFAANIRQYRALVSENAAAAEAARGGARDVTPEDLEILGE
ncbi:MAG TPA: endolytic transglycosylase MltG [Oligoflexia bacterium]|nr:endolytic transglycosylase MltG [Oligoflexia bacterium]